AEHGRMAADLASSRELLARADRLSALGMLAAGVAHEIRNPLVSVRTFIQLLPERLGDEEFRTTFRDLALAEIERICGLINDLLAFSQPAHAQVDPADLNDLVAQIVRLLAAEARTHAPTVPHAANPALPHPGSECRPAVKRRAAWSSCRPPLRRPRRRSSLRLDCGPTPSPGSRWPRAPHACSCPF